MSDVCQRCGRVATSIDSPVRCSRIAARSTKPASEYSSPVLRHKLKRPDEDRIQCLLSRQSLEVTASDEILREAGTIREQLTNRDGVFVVRFASPKPRKYSSCHHRSRSASHCCIAGKTSSG